MRHTIHARGQTKKQKWLDIAYEVLQEAGEPLSGAEVYSRTCGRINYNHLPKSQKTAGQLFRYDCKNRFEKIQIGQRNQYIYGLREWSDEQ